MSLLSVDAGSTVNDTLSGVNLVRFQVLPFTFQEAIEQADSTIDDSENERSILGGATFYASDFGDDDFEEENEAAFA